VNRVTKEENQMMPLQPIIKDKNGVLRYRENKVVCLMEKMLEENGKTLNDIIPRAHAESIGIEDLDQFYQLIGYSVSGAPVSDTVHELADRAVETGETQVEAERNVYKNEITRIREHLTPLASELFGIHEDDLQGGICGVANA
jgi:hypothetical protein